MNKVLGLDYGEKRMGIAISDPGQGIAFPRETLKVVNETETAEHLKNLIEAEGVKTLVLGWPLSLQGKKTAQTEATEAFKNWLHTQFPDLEIITMDERWTTIQSEKVGGDDAVAAQILLQTYLDMVK